MQYTWGLFGDRYWRKNRRPGELCIGVDLNRNYKDHWGGVSNLLLELVIIIVTCVVVNRKAVQEMSVVRRIVVQVQLLSQKRRTLKTTSSEHYAWYTSCYTFIHSHFILRSNGPIIGAIDWHSFGQLILRPYGMSL